MANRKNVEDYDKDFLIKLLKEMILIRRFEERAGQMYGLKKIGGFCHLYIGQEAVSTGTISALDLSKDYILTSYRDHGHAISCGMSINSIMAELYGKADGCSKGKGGSMHLFDTDHHMYGGNGIVGGHIPVATGVAYKIMYKEEDGVVLCFFGDGAIHMGSFHESLNMAKIWNLPIIYICENNYYGMGTDFRRVSSVEDFSLMGDSYGIEGRQINGMDVLEVYETAKSAVEKARQGNPMFLEIKTYRYKGHSMSDPAKYRSKEEVEKYKDQDPIVLLKEQMLEAKLLTEAEYKQFDDESKALSQESVQFAEESPEPEINDLYNDVLVD